MPPALFAMVILEIDSCFFAQAGLDCNPPILHFPQYWNDGHEPQQLFSFEMESHKIFCPGWAGTLILPISAFKSLR
jgi:hypothetical protein